MSALVRDIGFVLMMLCAVSALVSIILYKRPDVAWSALFLAGPMTIVKPSRYLRSDRARVPAALFSAALLLLVAVWIASWAIDNSP